MFPPIFAVCAANLGVQSKLGVNPTRLFPFGLDDINKTQPYAVWQTISGRPENYLGCLPDTDFYSLQVDVYAKTATLARDAAKALRDAIEPVAYVVNWRGESREKETLLYRYSFDVDWILNR